MPKTTRGRTREEERIVAQRILDERERRRWSRERLAAAMADAGCPLHASAIYKIENADPPRRITLNEFLAFAAVFEMDPAELLLPPTPPDDRRVNELIDTLRRTSDEAASSLDEWCSAHEELYLIVGVDPKTWTPLRADLEKVRSRIRRVVTNLTTSIQYEFPGKRTSRGQHPEAL